MRPLSLDATLRGDNGIEVPVHCELRAPHVGGQKLEIYLAIPAQNLRKPPPLNPCTLRGTSGSLTIEIDGLYWREFPILSRTALGLETVELFHIDRLTIKHNYTPPRREIKFHLAPVSYLREEYNFQVGSKSKTKELFTLNLPGLGTTRFIAEEIIIHQPETQIPTATSIVGFSAAINLTNDTEISVEQYETKFRTVLDLLSIFFRQAISLRGWTYTGDRIITTWINPLDQVSAPCSREERGKYIAVPKNLWENITNLIQAYDTKNEKTKLLVRELAVTLNPHIEMPTPYQFLSMWRILEQIVNKTHKQHKTPPSWSRGDDELVSLLRVLKSQTSEQGGKYSQEIPGRLEGFIRMIEKGGGFQRKFEVMERAYPSVVAYKEDLWPILDIEKQPGLRKIRDALVHQKTTSLSSEAFMVANWHLAIFLERLIFILLETDVPNGIQPDSFWLKKAGGVYYQKNEWKQMQARALRHS